MNTPERATVNTTEVERLPPADRVESIHLGTDGYARLQYRSGERICEIRFTVNEIFRMEEFFIIVRRRLGEKFPRYKA